MNSKIQQQDSNKIYQRENAKLDILYIASTRWDFLYQRPQQIASRLSENNRVLFFNHSIGKSYNKIKKIFDNPTLLEERLQKINDQLWVFSAFHLKSPYSDLSIDEFNKDVKIKCIEFLLNKLDFHDTVVITNLPDSLEYLEGIPKKILCYDCLDSHSSFSWNSDHIGEKENALAAHSDFVTASAISLYEKMKGINAATFLLPNAVDFHHFYKVHKNKTTTKKKKIIFKPIIGFIGAFYEWVDQELIYFLAKAKPHWEFKIIGPVQQGIPNKLLHLRNVKFLGIKEYDNLPMYMAEFNVCIIPFKVNETTLNTNPIKMWEYLATGIPIVSTPIPEAKALDHVIYIGENKEEFLMNIKKVLKKNDTSRLLEGISLAEENDWQHRVELLTQLFYDAIDKKIKVENPTIQED